MLVGIIIGAVVTLSAIVNAIFQNIRSRRVLISLDDMLDGAINGKISESYNDTLKSAIEHKLLKYIIMTEAEKQKLENDKEQVRTLISDISHQTKTSISNIKVYSQLLHENDVCLEDKLIISEILKHSSRLEFLIGTFIKMSRLESGIFEMKPEAVSAVELIGMALSPIFMKAKKKEASIIIKCDEDIILYCDKKWTAEAIGNVIDNAVKYTQQGYGEISIIVKKLEMYTKIIIEDNGIGLDELEITNIFKRFYRGRKVLSEEGVGIGLYISREIMNRQGGYITASSKNGITIFSIFVYNQI